MAFEPYAEEWLAFEKQAGGRFVLGGTLEEQRQQFFGLGATIAPALPPRPANIKVEDTTVEKSGCRVRIYTPTDAEGPLPIGLYIHSGGWYTGSIEAEEHLCLGIIERVPIILFSVEYRLAPEHVYPAAAEDCFAAYEWMCLNAREHTGDPTKAFILGGSAGGNLSGAVALKYSSEALPPGIHKPVGVMISVPCAIDPRALPEEYKNPEWWNPERYSDSAVLSRPVVQDALRWYNGAGDPSAVYVSIALHPGVDSLPPVYLAACTKDPTYDDTRIFHDVLRKAGVEVQFKEYKGYPHFFFIIPMLTMSAEFWDQWCWWLKGRIGEVS